MKITEIDTVVVDGGMRNWVFVQVGTDEGVQGLGEATLEGKAETMVAAVGELGRLVVGRDPCRIQHLWQIMYRHSFWRGGPVLMSAISGIEQALWDITGKVAGCPLCPARRRVPRPDPPLCQRAQGKRPRRVRGERVPHRRGRVLGPQSGTARANVARRLVRHGT